MNILFTTVFVYKEVLSHSVHRSCFIFKHVSHCLDVFSIKDEKKKVPGTCMTNPTIHLSSTFVAILFIDGLCLTSVDSFLFWRIRFQDICI